MSNEEEYIQELDERVEAGETVRTNNLEPEIEPSPIKLFVVTRLYSPGGTELSCKCGSNLFRRSMIENYEQNRDISYICNQTPCSKEYVAKFIARLTEHTSPIKPIGDIVWSLRERK